MRWAVWIFALSGFCAMAYEVLWTRLLGLMAGPTHYCFALVGATFIIGLVLLSRYPCWQNSLLSRGWYRDFDAIEPDLARIGWAQALLSGHNTVEPFLHLVEFAAAANLPRFNVLPWAHLDPDQKSRYKQDVMDYCRRVPVLACILVAGLVLFPQMSLKASPAPTPKMLKPSTVAVMVWVAVSTWQPGISNQFNQDKKNCQMV